MTVAAAKPSKHRLSEAVYQSLLEFILSGQLVPGEVASELALAKRLGVSRSPVHDALRMLIRDGLVRQERNRRAVVMEFTADDIREVFEMRQLLEGETAFRAAGLIDRPTLAVLHQQLETLEARWGKPGWVERWADHDDDFHGTIAKACGNRRLRQDVRRYRVLHRGLNRTHHGTSADTLRQALREHRAILAALDARDPDAARTAMVQHIREWQTYFMQNFRRLGGE